MRKLTLRLSFVLAVAATALFFAGCASMLPASNGSSSKLYVGPSESLLLRVQPFDSVVKADLVRGGLDPVRFEEAFNTELRYRFSQRKQEVAYDSAGAEVILTVQFEHLQPGSGNFGTFGALRMQTLRKKSDVQWTAWEWRKSAKSNVAPDYLERHLVGLAGDEIMSKVLATRPRPKEPPPPLHLMR